MTKVKRKKLLKYIRRWTRSEIMSRLGKFDNLEYIDYFQYKIKFENKIRELLYGSSDFVELGLRWGLLRKDKDGKFKTNKKTTS
jgi:hypothetical protein